MPESPPDQGQFLALLLAHARLLHGAARMEAIRGSLERGAAAWAAVRGYPLAPSVEPALALVTPAAPDSSDGERA